MHELVDDSELPRSADVLLPIIQKHVLPGTKIMSDLWKAYGGIERLPEGYKHAAVNHKYNFVDPEDSTVHTQSVESTWQKFKTEHHSRYGTHRDLLATYICDFIFKKIFKVVFFTFLSNIRYNAN